LTGDVSKLYDSLKTIKSIGDVYNKDASFNKLTDTIDRMIKEGKTQSEIDS
jgi:hypothetical protein